MFPDRGYTPIFKFYIAKTASRTSMWTPASSAKIMLTHLAVSTSVPTTFRVEFGTSNGVIIMDHWAQGSAMVYPLTSAWVESPTYDCPLVISFGPGLSASTENNYVTAQGYEDRP